MKQFRIIAIGLLTLIGAQAFAQANISLSNLSAVSINASMIPGTDGAIDVGSSTKRVNDIYVKNKIIAPEFATSYINFYPGDGGLVVSGTAYTQFIGYGPSVDLLSVNSASPGNIRISSNPTGMGYTAPNSNVNSGNVLVATGQTYGTGDSGTLTLGTGVSASDSGNVEITTGSASGVRGIVAVSARALQLPTATSDPGSPSAGFIYFNTSTSKLRLYDGSAWVSLN